MTFKKYKKQLAILGVCSLLGFSGFHYIQNIAEAKAISREAKVQEQNAVIIEQLRQELEKQKQDNAKLKEENQTLRQQNETLETEKKTVLANTFNVEATAYTDGGTTAIGVSTYGQSRESAMLIAVDPNIIPLGSKVKVTFDDPRWSHYNGIYYAADTGGAIVGHTIVIFVGHGNDSEALQFGRRSCKVTILE